MNNKMDAATCLGTIPEYALEIREHLYALAIDHVDDKPVHFRPTRSGITMVSLSSKTPQLGKGGFKQAKSLAEDFDAHYEKHISKRDPPGRPTPEKELQSFLIRDAYRHDGRMRTFEDALYKNGETSALYFVTDETDIEEPDAEERARKGKYDLLACRKSGEKYQPVLIELKSARVSKQSVRQLKDYSELMQKCWEQFETLCGNTLGQEMTLQSPPQKWIVWPSVTDNAEQDRRTSDLIAQGIRVFQYVHNDHIYALRTDG